MRSIFRRLRSALGNAEPAAPSGLEGLRIRSMGVRDLQAVGAIEQVSFGSPWRVSSYARAVREGQQQFFVATLDGELIGYGGFWVEQDRAHIAKVAVHPSRRRRGIGSAIVERLLDEIRRRGIGYAYLEVRKSNRGAQELYRRFGFRFERVQPNAYPNDGEDALVFSRDDLLALGQPTDPGTGAGD